jgi:tRNA1Val (adenine37-N6)-methyltransferase
MFFRFKQFTVMHERCAMKVGTDGVLLGAWTAVANVRRIVDIGTGTGLLALMLAQRSQALIDAVEIDQNACAQAAENIQRSPWPERIRVYHGPIQTYATAEQKPYDLAVANPPFFDNAYKTPQLHRNLARHDDTLSQSDLIAAAGRLLNDDGRLSVIYPEREARRFQQLAEEYGWHCRQILYVKPRPDKAIKRLLMEFGRTADNTDIICRENTLVLERARHVYTDDFINLIKDFYLKY